MARSTERGRGLPRVARAYATVTDLLKGISGLDGYERYVQHQRIHHPGEPMLDERTYWRRRWDDESSNPKARCC